MEAQRVSLRTAAPPHHPREQNTRLGILLMVLTTVIFSVQDGMSRHLGATYNVWIVVMLRYWFFAVLVLVQAARRPGGIRATAATRRPGVQILRGLLLVAEIGLMIVAFVALGLIETHAAFASFPLLVAALSGPVLGEKVGWRRWSAIAVGFIGVLVILQPGAGVFDPRALIGFAAAAMFALYSLLTRYVSRFDRGETSFFWTGIAGAVAATPLGLWFWQPMSLPDWGWMLALCICAALGHWVLIRVYELAEASAVQPFAYFQLIWVSIVGALVFGDVLRPNVALGAAIVVSAGLFTLFRERVRARAAR